MHCKRRGEKIYENGVRGRSRAAPVSFFLTLLYLLYWSSGCLSQFRARAEVFQNCFVTEHLLAPFRQVSSASMRRQVRYTIVYRPRWMPIREADPRHSSRSSRVIRAGLISREASVSPGSSRSIRIRDHPPLGITQNGSLHP